MTSNGGESAHDRTGRLTAAASGNSVIGDRGSMEVHTRITQHEPAAIILLAISTFRQSEELVRHTLKAAHMLRVGLFVYFVVDVNLYRYLVGSGVMAGTDLREQCEKEMLEDFLLQARERVDAITSEAARVGVPCETKVTVGRFGVEIVQASRTLHPRFIALTRSKRPNWVRKAFGSPVDTIMRACGCPVFEDFRCDDGVPPAE